MNRKHRRTLERLQRSQAPTDAQALQARAQVAAAEVQRLTAMFQQAHTALQLASQIKVVECPADVAVEDDPNFFRTAAIEDFEERVAGTRMKLIGAHEEFFLALEALDPADAPRVQVVPTIVTP